MEENIIMRKHKENGQREETQTGTSSGTITSIHRPNLRSRLERDTLLKACLGSTVYPQYKHCLNHCRTYVAY